MASPRNAERVGKQSGAQLEFNCRDLFITEFSPALGVHTVPGLLGLAFYVAD